MDETRSISVTEPIGEAIDWTRERLFEPFDPGEWFVYGFAWFLATLAKFGGPTVNLGGTTGEFSMSVNAETPTELFEQIIAAVDVWHVVAGVVGLLVIGGLLALFLWLGSRGTFLFLDATVREEAAITEPWQRYRTLGNSLFRVRLVYVLVTGVLMIVLPGVLVSLLVFALGTTPAVFVILLVTWFVWTPLLLLSALVYQMLADFVAPIMLQKDLYCWAACKRFWTEVLSGHLGTFLLFYLLKGLLWFASLFLIAIGGCLTCFLGFLPYLLNVLFLPIGVFFRTYSLRMLAQFGPDWSPAGQKEDVVRLF